MKQERRSDRLFVQVPVYVSGRRPWVNSFEEQTSTVMLNRHGASVALNRELLPHEIVYVRNLRNGLEGKFKVVGETQNPFGNGREWGLEALAPRDDFWGIDFSTSAKGTHPKLLLQCVTCRKSHLMKVSWQDYNRLLEAGNISSYCGACAETTLWLPALPEKPETGVPKTLEANHRSQLRLNLVMLVQIRNRLNGVQTVQTVDASRSGLGFTTRRKYQLGERVYLTLPFDAAWEAPAEAKGRTVRELRSPTARVYGLHFDELTPD